MRLSDIERGDGFGNRLLIGFISTVTRMRLPDAARFAFYHKAFFGDLAEWTQRTMRGPSDWTIGERELMAASIAKWNTCPFCVGAHGAIAAKQMQRSQVDKALANYRDAGLSDKLVAMLGFLEKLNRDPDSVTAADAAAVLAKGVSRAAFTDAVAVATTFGIVTRNANALDFAMLTPAEFDRAADMLLKRGYS